MSINRAAVTIATVLACVFIGACHATHDPTPVAEPLESTRFAIDASRLDGLRLGVDDRSLGPLNVPSGTVIATCSRLRDASLFDGLVLPGADSSAVVRLNCPTAKWVTAQLVDGREPARVLHEIECRVPPGESLIVVSLQFADVVMCSLSAIDPSGGCTQSIQNIPERLAWRDCSTFGNSVMRKVVRENEKVVLTTYSWNGAGSEMIAERQLSGHNYQNIGFSPEIQRLPVFEQAVETWPNPVLALSLTVRE